jgi:hypothetical protein
LGRLITDNTVLDLIKAIKEVKADNTTLEIQREYFEKFKD